MFTKRKHFNKLLLGLSITILSCSAVGCKNTNISDSKQSTDSKNFKLKVIWWGNDKRKTLTEDVIKLFQKNHPNIEFETTSYASTGDLMLNLAMNTADQQMPDIIQTDISFSNNYIKRNLFEPLDSYIKQNILSLSDIDKSFLESGTYNNQLFGIPLGVNAFCMNVNPLVFKNAGVDIPQNGYTYDDLYKVATELKAKVNDPNFYPLANFVSFDSFVRAKGAFVYNSEGKSLGYQDDQIFADYIKTQKKWLDEGLIAPSSVSDKNALFTSGKAAFIYAVSNGTSNLSASANTVIKIITVPSGTAGKISSYVRPSQFFSVSAYSEHKNEAVEFVNFITNDIDANNILKGERGVPVSSKVYESLEAKINEADKQQYSFMKYIKENPSAPNPPTPNTDGNVNSLLSRLSDQVLSGTMSPEDGAKQFREGANKILSGVKGGQ
jgi:multiple sugar transport system substrate-binding protein